MIYWYSFPCQVLFSDSASIQLVSREFRFSNKFQVNPQLNRIRPCANLAVFHHWSFIAVSVRTAIHHRSLVYSIFGIQVQRMVSGNIVKRDRRTIVQCRVRVLRTAIRWTWHVRQHNEFTRENRRRIPEEFRCSYYGHAQLSTVYIICV